MCGVKADSLERYLFRSNPFQLFAISLVSGMLVLFLSIFVGIDQLTITHNGISKDLSLWYTPNWVIVYLILFPLFLVLLSEQSTYVRSWLKTATGRSVIADDGGLLSTAATAECLDRELSSYNMSFGYLLLVTAVVALGGWYISFYVPLSCWCLKKDEAIGWGLAAIIRDPNREIFNQHALIFYTLLAYIWMGLALYIYIACLWFNVIYANFFYRLAHGKVNTTDGRTLRLLSRKELPPALADYLYRFLAASFLGLIAAFLMQLESQYLLSDEKSMSSFWFGDIAMLMNGKKASFADFLFVQGRFQDDSSRDETRFTSLAVLAATTVAFGAGIWLVHSALKAARAHTLFILPNSVLLDSIDLHLTKTDIKTLRAGDEMKQVFPTLRTSATLCLGVIICTIIPKWGTLFSATILYAAFRHIKTRIDRFVHS